MLLSEAGALLIRNNEAFRANAYLDSKGVPTIGYGTTLINGHVPVTMGMTCTPEQALTWFQSDCRKFVAAINDLVKIELTQNQFDALVSFVYNVGIGGFTTSSLLRAINHNQPIVEDPWTRWNKIRDPHTGQLVVLNGLTTRRQREYQHFIS